VPQTEGNLLELTTRGLQAFQAENYLAAISCFSEVKRYNPQLWECRLYLAMSYARISKMGSALQEFRNVAEACPEPRLKRRCVEALQEIRTGHFR